MLLHKNHVLLIPVLLLTIFNGKIRASRLLALVVL